MKRLGNVEKAFSIIEQSRGRSEADSLRGRFAPDEEKSNQNPVEGEIARLQWRLMRTANRGERKTLLEKLFDAEERLGPSFETGRHSVHSVVFEPAALAAVQSSLGVGELLTNTFWMSPNLIVKISREDVQVYTIDGRRQIENGSMNSMNPYRRSGYPAGRTGSIEPYWGPSRKWVAQRG